jgi:hypothetical protein
MFLAKKHLSRRTVLRGLGVSIGLPLLDAMIPAATALAKTAAKPRTRLGFVYVPHGTVLDRWTPRETGTKFELPQILKPLEPHKSHLTVVSGLENRAAESSAPHAITSQTWLTCVHPDPQRISADQLAVPHIAQDTPVPSLELATESESVYGSVSFGADGQPLPTEHDPRKVFNRLFGSGLDPAMPDAKALRKTLGNRDALVLDGYLDSVRDVERRTQRLEKADDFDERLGVMFDLLALSFQADLTRIFTFMMGHEMSMRRFHNIGVPEPFHALSHHGNDAAKLDKLARIHAYHAAAFAHFIGRLHNMPDGDGPMLDRSIILYGGNMGDSDKHDHGPLPAAVVGSGNRSIPGGRHIRMPDGTPLANLLLTLLQRAGVSRQTMDDGTASIAAV